LIAAEPALGYAEFAAALKDALRDLHRADLLARNPLLRDRACNLGSSAKPSELKALMAEAVSTLFGNPRDEKLRRVIELTYFQPAPKQEVVVDRLSLSFGTYRRYLTTARERLARWLWEGSHFGSIEKLDGRAPLSSVDELAAPPLSLVVLPFPQHWR
jgi:hypothetical protein